MESLETRALLAGDLAAGAEITEFEPMDVNQDGTISAQDAIMVLNAMLSQAASDETSNVDEAGWDEALDVNSDGALSPQDALMVLNRMQRAV